MGKKLKEKETWIWKVANYSSNRKKLQNFPEENLTEERTTYNVHKKREREGERKKIKKDVIICASISKMVSVEMPPSLSSTLDFFGT